jgi:hypothetical protein
MAAAGYDAKAMTGYDVYAADTKLHAKQAVKVLRIWQTEQDETRKTLLTGIFHTGSQVDAWVKSFNQPGCQVVAAYDPVFSDNAGEISASIVKTLPAVGNYYQMMTAGGFHPGYTVAVKCDRVKEQPKPAPKPAKKPKAK